MELDVDAVLGCSGWDDAEGLQAADHGLGAGGEDVHGTDGVDGLEGDHQEAELDGGHCFWEKLGLVLWGLGTRLVRLGVGGTVQESRLFRGIFDAVVTICEYRRKKR